MILIGMYDSPFTRRVAIALALRGIAFEHRAWSVGADFDRIREYSPLGRVPVLVLDDGEALMESSSILDWIQHETDGVPLLPASGRDRREAMRLIGLASGAADRCVAMVLERIFHSEAQQSQAFLARSLSQIEGVFGALDAACAARGGNWLVGDAMTLADITIACYVTHSRHAAPVDLARWPALMAHVERCEALEVFAAHYAPFYVPQPKGAKEVTE
ncbi:glutathione S-transferase family protein [Cognatilysobacter lacus]|uniref:Glutathione S-transferase family protein n=1 Tax=Cognatilysobacter lacus TaxID=1643323 RepID=A0A5D8Z0D2_9GAMM|nr:glutathione S-transferase family protein [Lysobacter lacus]TZF88137.1 glutathione S-transferase family protein [Lysobacter lacus]